jgi:hypothetical protein
MKSNGVIVVLILIVAALVGSVAWLLSRQSKTSPGVAAAPVEKAAPAPAPEMPAKVAEPAVQTTPAPPVEMVAEQAAATPPAKKRPAIRRKRAKAAPIASPPPVEEPPRIEVYRGAERQIDTVRPAKQSDAVNIEVLKGSQRQSVTPPMPTNREPKN